MCDFLPRVQVLAELTDRNRVVLIPGFCSFFFSDAFSNAGSRALTCFFADDQVRPQDDEEAALFRLLESATQQSAASLSTRWREPSLTIHSVRGSGPTSTPFRLFFTTFSTWAECDARTTIRPHGHTSVRHGAGLVAHSAGSVARRGLHVARPASPRVVRLAVFGEFNQGSFIFSPQSGVFL